MRIKFEQARNAAHVLGRDYKASDLAELLDCSRVTAWRWLVRLSAEGMVGHNGAGGRSRRWHFIPAREREGYTQEPREHRLPPELEVRAQLARSRGGAGHGDRGARRRLREFEQRTGAKGYRVVGSSKHSLYLQGPEGRVAIAKSPGDHRADRNALAKKHRLKAA